MNTYTLFWLTGKAELVKGTTIADAMRGYSSGALPALDFYAAGDLRDKYTWNTKTHGWDMTAAYRIEKFGTAA